ncbi:MAG: DUF1353 domain-containing protein [Verrucomicrobiia bacterium]
MKTQWSSVCVLAGAMVCAIGLMNAVAGGREPTKGKQPWGEFKGTLHTHRPTVGSPEYKPKWGKGQEILDEDFGYEDPSGILWVARKGQYTDGASIPTVIWCFLFGTPWNGEYVHGAVIHDAYCQNKGEKLWIEVHRMFYNAMRCGGTPSFRAEVMYFAVLKFGPPKDRSLFARLFLSPDGTAKNIRLAGSLSGMETLLPYVSERDQALFFAHLESRPATKARNEDGRQAIEFLVNPKGLLPLAEFAQAQGRVSGYKTISADNTQVLPTFAIAAGSSHGHKFLHASLPAVSLPWTERPQLLLSPHPTVVRTESDPQMIQLIEGVSRIAKQHVEKGGENVITADFIEKLAAN